ncbi:MAG: Crp/Fnr family transcriptional regulator [Treponema sp.]|nr:Crp/Fnr family transcriptional regulator [Treponema sp.]
MPKPIQFGANALIYCVGDNADKVFVLQQGKVWLTYTDIETGEETSDVVGPGEFFGVKPVLGQFPCEENAITKESCTVLAFTPSEFELLLLSNDRIVMKMLKVFSEQLRRVHTRISNITNTRYVKPDYGLYEIGEKYVKRNRFSHAKYIFQRYLELYPDEENSEDVKEYLNTLKNTSLINDQSRNYAGTIPKEKSVSDDSLQVDTDLLSRFSRSFKAGEIIFSEYEPGNTFYLIQSGYVKLTKNAGQHERTLDILSQSEIFGEMAILDDSSRTASAIAMNDVTVLEFTGRNFEILMQGYPQIAIKLLKVFAKRIHHSKRRFMILTLPDSQAKVADVFLMLDDTRNTAKNVPNEKTLDYSREFHTSIEDIAHWAGLSVGETKEVLDYYVTQRRLVIYQGRVVVKNINDFSRLVTSRRNHD